MIPVVAMNMKTMAIWTIAILPALAFAEWADIPIDKVVADSDLVLTATLTNVQRVVSNDLVKCEGVLIPIEILKGTQPKQIKLTWAFSVPPEEDSVDHSGLAGKTLLWLLKRRTDGTYDAHYLRRVQPLSKKDEIVKIIESHNKQMQNIGTNAPNSDL